MSMQLGTALSAFGAIEVTLPGGTTHDLSPADLAGAIVIYVTADALGSAIGGIADNTPDRLIFLRAIAGGALNILHEDTSCFSAHRILTIQSTTVNLSSYLSMALIYDAVSARWREIGKSI